MSKTSKIVLGVVVTLFVALALGAVATKKDSTPSSTPSVTLVPNSSSSSSSNCPSLLAKYVALNQQAASVLDGINSTPGAAAALASEIHALVVADVDAGRKLIVACPQYSYLSPSIDQLEATQNS